MMTGSGMDMGVGGSFGMSWLGVVILFFIGAFAYKWLCEEWGMMPFSRIGGAIGAYVPYFLMIYFFCSFKIALVVGLIGMIIGAYFGGSLLGDGGDGF
jgi:hypothetical protein